MLPASDSPGALESADRCGSQSAVFVTIGMNELVPVVLVTVRELVVAIVAILVMVTLDGGAVGVRVGWVVVPGGLVVGTTEVVTATYSFVSF